MKKTEEKYKIKKLQWEEMQNNFKKHWSDIKESQRVEIHIPSLSYDPTKRNSMEKFMYRQNIQLTRIFRCKDPNVKIL